MLLAAREVVLHEEAGVHGEAGGEEGVVDGAGVVEEELRLDAVDAGGVMQELEKLVEEVLGDLKHLRGVVCRWRRRRRRRLSGLRRRRR